jgi:hypothetical protein
MFEAFQPFVLWILWSPP